MHTRSIGPVRRAANRLVTWLYPPHCPICMRRILWRPDDGRICHHCAQWTQPVRPPFCDRCGRPVQGDQGRSCQDCILDPPEVRCRRSAFLYNDPIREAILAFKMRREIHRAPSLASLLLLTESLGINWEGYDLVLPVPLHNSRLRWRGFNQCALLVREIALYRKFEFSDDALVRNRQTRPQFELTPKKRLENVRGAFSCPRPDLISGKTVLIVDDISTTGATLNECAKALKKAGASYVDAATLCRATG